MYRVYRDTPIGNATYFNFDTYTEAISEIILFKENKTPFSIAINGKWGSGKTTLMKTLRAKLDEKSGENGGRKVRTVWFDAWKYSETDSMLSALVLEILEEMGRKGIIDKIKDKTFFGTEKVDLLKPMTDLAKILTLNNGPEFDKWIHKAAYQEKLSFYDIFQDYMEKILRIFVLGKENGKYTDKEGVLVIFIDDLDRCPPKKITKVLESINMFFDQEGCFFIIGTDVSLISKAIDAEYSELKGFSGNDYLKKMIQLQFNLPAIRENELKVFMQEELKIDLKLSNYFDVITKGLDCNQREIKRFINSLNLMRVLGNSIKDFSYKDELLIKWNILSFSFEDFIKQVEINHKFLVEMQKISRIENEKDLEIFFEKELKSEYIKELCNRYRNKEKILNVLKCGEEEFEIENIPNYIFLSNFTPQKPQLKEETRVEYPGEYSEHIRLKILGRLENSESNKDLHGIDLSNGNLRGINFNGVNLKNANLKNSNLKDANLQNVILKNASLKGANLSGANLKNSLLTGANFRGSIFDNYCLSSIIESREWEKAHFDQEVKEKLESMRVSKVGISL